MGGALKWLERYLLGLRTKYAPIVPGDEHDLPGYLVVSLTSYPARFPTLSLTLRSLLSQDMAPDRLVLWIASEHMDMLPANVLALQQHGLEIRPCPDLGSFKKIIPALQAFPDYSILTADDDVHYPKDWLRRFVEEYRDPSEVLCQRARGAVVSNGQFASYRTWKVLTAPDIGPHVFPTGMAGILYPPHCLDGCAADFMELCPNGDDIWLYWMARRNGCVHRLIAPAGKFIAWPKSQRVALWRSNNTGTENDRHIAAMVATYGDTASPPVASATVEAPRRA